jgi:hypothetical protein
MPWVWRGISILAALLLLVALGWSHLPDRPAPAVEAGLPPLSAPETLTAQPPQLLSLRLSYPAHPISHSVMWPLARAAPRRAAVPVAVAAHASAAAPQPAGSPQPLPTTPALNSDGGVPAADESAIELTLVELRLGRLVARTVPAYRVGDEALLPVGEFLKMAQLRGSVSPAGRVQASIEPGNQSLVLDARRDSATIGRRAVPIPRELKIFHQGELYVAASRLGELLGIGFAVSWPDLEVVVADPSLLPVALQQRRRAARAALLHRDENRLAERTITAERRVWDGFVMDYSWLMPGNEGLGGSSYTVAAGTSAVGGSLEVGVSSVGRADSGQVRVDASWLRVWRQSPWLKQVRLGDGVITGLGTTSLRGVSLTNAPFVRPSLLGDLYYGGRLPPGWEVEAYRGGELLWVDSTDQVGNFAAHLPVMYGENPVDFIAYGPTGETRRFSRTYLVADELLPAGTLEYGLSAGDCRFPSCRAGANVDLRYGLSQRWALRAGADRFWRGDTLPNLFHPYAAVSGSLTNAMLVQVQAVKDGFIQGRLNFEPSLDLRLTADYTRFDTRTPAPLLSTPDRRSQFGFSGFLRPIPRRDFFYLEGSFQRTVATTGTTDAARLGVSLQAGDVRVLPYARADRQALPGSAAMTHSYWGLNSFILPRPSWGPLFRQLWIRTGFESEGLWRPTLASIQVARPLTPNVRLDLGMSWARGAPGPTFTLNLASNLRSVRSVTTMSAAQGSSASLTQLVQGSVLYNRASGGFGLGAGPSLQRAGLAGRVFLDQNGNGLYDPGERGLDHVRVQVGASAALSDSAGAYQVWDIVPFEPVLVAVDSLSFESPLWIAPTPVVRVIPGPNQFTLYDVPIIVGGVLEGQVTGPDGESGMGGITLLLSRSGTDEQRRITTFSDGAFYVLGLAPGDYDLSVDPELLERMGYGADRPRVVVPAGSEEDGKTVNIRLRPRP